MATKFEVNQKVIASGTKDAVISSVVLVKKAPGKTMYMVEYTVDDELERANPTGKRYTQPRFESELTVAN